MPSSLIWLFLFVVPHLAHGRPNIIIMQPDDFGFLSSWDPPAHFPGNSPFSSVSLPHIESLRSNGLEMLRAYAASPMCGTSRYSTITGRYPSRSSISRRKNRGSAISDVSIPTTKLSDVRVVDDGNDCSHSNLAALFQTNGYATGMTGKWHLTTSTSTYDYATVQDSVRACGFDTAEAVYHENLNDNWNNNGQLTHNMEHLTAEAIKFIDQANAESKPFFLYFNPTAPHSSGNVYDALTASSCQEGPEGTLSEEPVVPGMTEGLGCAKYRQTVIDRANGDNSNAALGSIWVDDAVGALLAHLRSIGKLDSTIFLFQMDHGQEGKGSLYEPGTRIAQFIHYPDKISPGSKYSGLVSTIDIAPTIASFADITDSSPGWYDMDGSSWRDLSDDNSDRCLVLELDFDRTVVCECDKYLYIGSSGMSTTEMVGSSNGLVTDSQSGLNLCNYRHAYSTSPATSSEAERVSSSTMGELKDLLDCHLDMTDPAKVPAYGVCNHLQQRSPAPAPLTFAPTAWSTQAPTVAPLCTCTADASPNDAFYDEVIERNRRIIRTNGIPSHTFHHGRERENPNPVCAHPSELSIPVEPEPNPDGFTDTGLGVIGILKTGAFLYNHKSNRNGIDDVANHPNNEQPSLDECHGHAGQTCQYHYHEISQLSSCTHDGLWDSCELIGWLRDGYPIYSHCRHPSTNRYLTSCFHLRNDSDNGGGDDTSDFVFEENSECDLDYANGYDFTGSGIVDSTGKEITGYAYVVSLSYPYVMTAYKGKRFWKVQSTEMWQSAADLVKHEVGSTGSEQEERENCFGSDLPIVGFAFSLFCWVIDFLGSLFMQAKDWLLP